MKNIFYISVLVILMCTGCRNEKGYEDLPCKQPYSSFISQGQIVYYPSSICPQIFMKELEIIKELCSDNKGKSSYARLAWFESQMHEYIAKPHFPQLLIGLLDPRLADDGFLSENRHLFLLVAKHWSRFTPEEQKFILCSILSGQVTPGPVAEQVYIYLLYVRDHGMPEVEKIAREVYRHTGRLMLPYVYFSDYIPNIFSEIIEKASLAKGRQQANLLDSVYYSYLTPLVPRELLSKLYARNPCKAFCLSLLATGDVEPLNSGVNLCYNWRMPGTSMKGTRVLPNVWQILSIDSSNMPQSTEGRPIYRMLIEDGISHTKDVLLNIVQEHFANVKDLSIEYVNEIIQFDKDYKMMPENRGNAYTIAIGGECGFNVMHAINIGDMHGAITDPQRKYIKYILDDSWIAKEIITRAMTDWSDVYQLVLERDITDYSDSYDHLLWLIMKENHYLSGLCENQVDWYQYDAVQSDWESRQEIYYEYRIRSFLEAKNMAVQAFFYIYGKRLMLDKACIYKWIDE